jgi:hypothetical protein
MAGNTQGSESRTGISGGGGVKEELLRQLNLFWNQHCAIKAKELRVLDQSLPCRLSSTLAQTLVSALLSVWGDGGAVPYTTPAVLHPKLRIQMSGKWRKDLTQKTAHWLPHLGERIVWGTQPVQKCEGK